MKKFVFLCLMAWITVATFGQVPSLGKHLNGISFIAGTYSGSAEYKGTDTSEWQTVTANVEIRLAEDSSYMYFEIVMGTGNKKWNMFQGLRYDERTKHFILTKLWPKDDQREECMAVGLDSVAKNHEGTFSLVSAAIFENQPALKRKIYSYKDNELTIVEDRQYATDKQPQDFMRLKLKRIY